MIQFLTDSEAIKTMIVINELYIGMKYFLPYNFHDAILNENGINATQYFLTKIMQCN
jgi:hypothetical protein